MEKIFITQDGICQIYPDKIVLSKKGIFGNMNKASLTLNRVKTLLVYGIFSIIALNITIKTYTTGSTSYAIGLGLLGLVLIYIMISKLRNSDKTVIERKYVKGITFKEEKKGITLPQFKIKFENKNGNLDLISIPLTSSFLSSDGQDNIEKAIKIMTEAELLSS
ncbi:MAG: hypothetical protein ABJD66_08870 [Cellulophaga sp.]|uniref:hypothetical protein n=1 Tax=Cellulophaga sp. TaxID=1972202 RepID=UPI0032648A39